MTDDLPNDPGAVIVRRYGLRPPLDWGKDCDDEMSRMTDLWNALVAIERDHRAVYFAATADDPDVAATEAARQALADRRGALVQQRAELRKAARKRVATRAAERGATVAQLEAIFGWEGGRMASLYTRAADRRRLAGEAIGKLSRSKKRTSIP